ncbi:CsgG/HfaB family protein [Fodinicurvata fenggangensis]|uniref:CsgG/HfaB family protein n=1 Tax=Fodinicurvata fenggangensis TaxID=1121830 RepID=UPI0009DD3883|nr:CsgG/HfaB family protein [Fodinicurvata fenggangensis]
MTQRSRTARRLLTGLAIAGLFAVSACAPHTTAESIKDAPKGPEPFFSFPVTSNDTPYSQCLASFKKYPANNLPAFTVGEVADKTGQIDRTSNSAVISQGVSEMVMSALWKTGKAKLVERFDLRIPLAEMKMIEQGLTTRPQNGMASSIRASDFVVLGALTELNYNIVSQGAGLWVGGIGAGARTVVINVGLDLRVVNSRNFDVGYVSSLQKQIYGYEVEANVFRFFGSQLVEFDAGRIQNEPLQLGVRSVVEMAIYQIMTEYFGLPASKECGEIKEAHNLDARDSTKKES